MPVLGLGEELTEPPTFSTRGAPAGAFQPVHQPHTTMTNNPTSEELLQLSLHVVSKLENATPDQRVEFFYILRSGFCQYCGRMGESYSCPCSNDG